ncbi:hypothetical protein EZJ43_07440 [Pedobacter changchengzhani]|uniref:Transcription elongation factor n=1 Tax=Pedobacter changchengzhani TaxID=2529274 RepID=A0A4R5MKY8_9SPHI|nr:hypothetical protein [Pedobacter changchengzhani]TDG36350.1 hypothetical protein EZJ43_07440 [Pedobacter changchengzhani]
MQNKITKTQILKACIQKQQELVDSFKEREAEIHKDAYSQNESDSQTEDRKADKLEVLNAIGNELIFADQELNYLNSMNVMEESKIVESGAVVVTDQITFFISVSSEKVEVDGEVFFGISTNAPIYASMKDLKKGSSFQYNETKYVIEDLY